MSNEGYEKRYAGMRSRAEFSCLKPMTARSRLPESWKADCIVFYEQGKVLLLLSYTLYYRFAS